MPRRWSGNRSKQPRNDPSRASSGRTHAPNRIPRFLRIPYCESPIWTWWDVSPRLLLSRLTAVAAIATHSRLELLAHFPPAMDNPFGRRMLFDRLSRQPWLSNPCKRRLSWSATQIQPSAWQATPNWPCPPGTAEAVFARMHEVPWPELSWIARHTAPATQVSRKWQPLSHETNQAD